MNSECGIILAKERRFSATKVYVERPSSSEMEAAATAPSRAGGGSFCWIRLDELVYWCTIVVVSEVSAKECEKSQLLRFATKES